MKTAFKYFSFCYFASYCMFLRANNRKHGFSEEHFFHLLLNIPYGCVLSIVPGVICIYKRQKSSVTTLLWVCLTTCWLIQDSDLNIIHWGEALWHRLVSRRGAVWNTSHLGAPGPSANCFPSFGTRRVAPIFQTGPDCWDWGGACLGEGTPASGNSSQNQTLWRPGQFSAPAVLSSLPSRLAWSW